MPDSRPKHPGERSEPPGSQTPGDPVEPSRVESIDPPTIRSGSGSGSGTGGSGTSTHRRAGVPVAFPEIGQRLESFELLEAIGAGGMGAVFLALDTRLDRHVALKILPPEQSSDSEVVQRFYQEGRAAARLDNENIARVYAIGHDKSYHFIAFEYIEGTTIRQRVERLGPLPVAETINYTLQIAGALVHASERGVVHRDIKPSNIIITPQGRAKLVDMGLARRFERDSANEDGLTQSGMTLGTFDYISPEQARDPRDVDVRSDLYSLGCTLFHMLTGRPPFPDGTVLQKLLQHQEDQPPDVRSLNPAVPDDLAAILAKLMAKDRDRRYQSPEQLSRDLLTLAGSLGLRSISPEGLVWMTSAPAAPIWERHLFWGLPTAVLGLLVGWLVWSGQAGPPVARSNATAATNSNAASSPIASSSTNKANSDPPPRPKPKNAIAATNPRVEAPRATKVEPTAEPPREYPVKAGDDLRSLLAVAPSGSTLVLTEDGPYDLRPRAAEVATRIERRNLTIRAGPRAKPTVRLGLGAGEGAGALIQFVGGRATFVGLDFQLETAEGPGTLTAIRSDDTELTLIRCLFRTKKEGARTSKLVALEVRSTRRADEDRPPLVTVDSCYFGPGQAGILAEGPAEIVLRDCSFGQVEPAIWLRDPAATAPTTAPAQLWLSHVSILPGDGPVFRFAGVSPRVRIDDSVVGSENDADSTLVAAFHPETLAWKGRSNLYAQIGTFLEPSRNLPDSAPAIWDFASWADDPVSSRETGSIATKANVWEETDPSSALLRKNPTLAFRLAAVDRPDRQTGVRRGPFGPLTPSLLALVDGFKRPNLVNAEAPIRKDRPTPAPTRGGSPPVVGPTSPKVVFAPPATGQEKEFPPPVTTDPDADEGTPVATRPGPTEAPRRTNDDVAGSPMTRKTDDPASGETSGFPEDMMDPADMATRPMERRSDPATEAASPVREGGNGSEKTAIAPPRTPSVKRTADPQGPPRPTESAGPEQPSVIRSKAQFLDAMTRMSPRGGTIRLAADADLTLSTQEIPGPGGRWTIEAAAGAMRPRIRFRPQSATEPKTPGSCAFLFRVHSGSLSLQGVDILLPKSLAPAKGRWGAFAIRAGAALSLNHCTVTIEGTSPRSAAIAIQGPENEAEVGAPSADATAASIRVTDCLLRVGDDLIDVAAGRKLDLEMNNAAIATGGSLVHGHGLPRGLPSETLKLTLREVASRTADGLVRLESAVGEPDLPMADVVARESIFASTVPDAPLFRVDGQDGLEGLRDRVKWEGHSVAYHQIEVYRRDQTAQLGNIPYRYDRPAWDVTVGPRENDPIHGDVRFSRRWTADREPWTSTGDDFRLAADSPAASAGPDLQRIPEPPTDDLP